MSSNRNGKVSPQWAEEVRHHRIGRHGTRTRRPLRQELGSLLKELNELASNSVRYFFRQLHLGTNGSPIYAGCARGDRRRSSTRKYVFTLTAMVEVLDKPSFEIAQ